MMNSREHYLKMRELNEALIRDTFGDHSLFIIRAEIDKQLGVVGEDKPAAPSNKPKEVVGALDKSEAIAAAAKDFMKEHPGKIWEALELVAPVRRAGCDVPSDDKKAAAAVAAVMAKRAPIFAGIKPRSRRERKKWRLA